MLLEVPEQSDVVIRQNGKPAAIVMSYERYQALQNELRLLKETSKQRLSQASTEFWRGLSQEELTRQQNIGPIQNFSEILGPVPPEGEESADEFIADIRRWREEDKVWE
jgi:prevent-host-death family protein